MLDLVSYFFGGAFLANAVPHLVSGMTGRPFQTPFAKPPGQGLSSSTVNVALGLLQSRRRLSARLPGRRFRAAGHSATSPRSASARLRWRCSPRGGSAASTAAMRRSAHDRPGVRASSVRCAVFNYRVWAAGAFVSNVGTWVQRTAQDWLVLTQLTHHDASAVGVVMALQFGPQLLFLPWTGFAADHFNQRKLLIATQATMGALALAAGLLTVTGLVQLWHVYVFAFLFGCAAAFDAPVRQTFVARAGRRRGPAERGGAQLDLVQRRADDRAGGLRA